MARKYLTQKQEVNLMQGLSFAILLLDTSASKNLGSDFGKECYLSACALRRLKQAATKKQVSKTLQSASIGNQA